ncbi:MAG: hypothetical protein Q9219_000875 [cf. Caloplaca sp. 3 TL-2023]
MSFTSTDTVIAAPLSSSIQSIGSIYGSITPSRSKNSQISKVYKQASALFLTKDFAEAFAALEPILRPGKAPEDRYAASDEDEPPRAPIAAASRNLRIKVWSLYLTLLNAIIELGPAEGKAVVGSKQWRDIAAKVRDGSIWEEVVQTGYGGVEGDVDAEVVSNLATLLLSHSASQAPNQQRLETYLATSDVARTPRPNQSTTNGTNSPQELASRIKILELYILHVLPANEEWEYAKEFIQMSDVLDDEQKELFQQALADLDTSKTRDGTRDRDQAVEELKQAEPKPIEDTAHPPEHRRSNSEHDYGIEEEEVKSHPEPPTLTSRPAPRSNSKPTQQRSNKVPSSKTSPRKSTNSGIMRRSAAFVAAFQRFMSSMTHSLSKNPLALLRFLLFLMALLVALSRRDVKDRIKRIAGDGWERIRKTIGMGMKVSYI